MTTQNNSQPPKSLLVRILDKDYHIACPPGAEADLHLSAQYLDKQMKAIRRTGKVVGLDRIAVMAGLNTAYDLLKATRQPPEMKPIEAIEPIAPKNDINTATAPLVNQKLNDLKNRIDEALSAYPNHTSSWATEESSLQVSALEVEY